jgi:hypothetical protein
VRSSRTSRLLALASTLALAVVLATVPGQAAVQSSAAAVPTIAPPPTGAGVDVSFPQCAAGSHVGLPASVPFAIVGVNGGVASNSNPCFLSEYNSALLLAGTTGQPHAAVYVNTGNPSLAATWWPSADKTQSGTTVSNPNGPCSHLAGASCAYIYGYSMAQADYHRVRQTLQRLPSMWWLDVETTNTWQPDVVANSASLIGMVDYFHSKGLDVGIYSTSYQWGRIAGATLPASHLAGLRSWLAGGSAVGAPADCERSPLTPNGRVAMVQYVTNLDNDYACGSFGNASASLSPDTASVVGTELLASAGDWGTDGVTFSYQWSGNGVPIAGATSADYITTASDVGTTVAVTITGTKLGYSSQSTTSEGVAVQAALVPAAVTIAGTVSPGQSLTASTAAWGPGTVALTYRWYRGATVVSSGPSATTYTVSKSDAGQYITVTVTGTETGYAPLTESAITARVHA